MLLKALPSFGKRDSSRPAAVYAGTVSATLRALTFFLPCGVSYVSLREVGRGRKRELGVSPALHDRFCRVRARSCARLTAGDGQACVSERCRGLKTHPLVLFLSLEASALAIDALQLPASHHPVPQLLCNGVRQRDQTLVKGAHRLALA